MKARSGVCWLLLVLCSNVFAESLWIKFAQSVEGDEYFTDLFRPAEGSSTALRIWEKVVFSTVQKNEEMPYNEEMIFREIDCKGKRIRTISRSKYLNNISLRNDRKTYLPSDWDFVPPDTVDEALMYVVCPRSIDKNNFDLDIPGMK